MMSRVNHGGREVGVFYEGGPRSDAREWPGNDFRIWDLELIDQYGRPVTLDWGTCGHHCPDATKCPSLQCSPNEVIMTFPKATI